MLTPEQQLLAAEAATKIAPVFIRTWIKNSSAIKTLSRACDFEGAAMIACCKASKTYDPSRGKMSTYFSKAIRSEIIKEIAREMKHGQVSVWRISLQDAETRQPPKEVPVTNALDSLSALSRDEADLVERRLFEKTTFEALAREAGRCRNAVRKRLMKCLDKIKFDYEDSAFS